MDYYKVLNLKEDATLKEIEQAYKDLSTFYNPNTNVSACAYKKYRMINKAYLTLKEEKQRELYKLNLKNAKKEKIKEDTTRLTMEDFHCKHNESNEDYMIVDEYSLYTHLKFNIPYLYYLLNSEYLICYKKKEIVSSGDICSECRGIGKVKSEEKIVYCSSCFSSGKKITYKENLINKFVSVKDKIIDDYNKLIVEFEFLNKDEYVVNNNEIYYRHKVSEDEFYNGIRYQLKSGDEVLLIEEKEFNELNKTYVFLDKIIKVEYILGEYNLVKKGYILTQNSVVYLNPRDFSYSFTSSDIYTYRLELKEKFVKVNLNKKEILFEVVRIKNDRELKVFFDKEIKKVSANLFRFKGSYNKHYFSKKGGFDYDEKYLYLPSLAYKLKSKYYTLFRILFVACYLFIPLILFFICGMSYLFFILSFIFLVIYLIVVNLLMEVKV